MPTRPRDFVHRSRALCSYWPWIVLLSIAPSALATSVDVEIEGVEDELKDNVEASLSIRRPGDDPTVADLRRLHDRAVFEIRLALEPFGYYAPQIDGSFDESGDDVKTRYVIDTGTRIHVQKFDLQLSGEASDDPGFRAIVDDFPVHEGDPLLHSAYESGKFRLRAYAQRMGYLDAAMDSSAILINLAEYHAAVVIHFDTGIRYEFGEIRLHQDVLNPEMVEGYVNFGPGDPYEQAKIAKLQSELASGPYFSLVEVHTRRDQVQNGQVPIDIDLIPAKTQRYEVGGGYGTDTGFRGRFGAEFRRLNRRGHHADFDASVSERELTASSRYVIPWPHPRTEELSFFGAFGRFDPGWSLSTRLTGGIGLSAMRKGWREILSVAYEYDDWEISDQEDITRLTILSGSWTRVRADNRFDPGKGYRLHTELRGTVENVGSDVSMVQGLVEIGVLRPVGGSLRALARASAGATATDEFEHLPPGQRFVTGGTTTVRGFSYESLGPRNDSDDLVGGDLFGLASFELEHRFLEDLGVAGFVDTGNTWDTEFEALAVGTGVGLRWASPVGLLRLDGAWGISRASNPFNIHFIIGPVF